MKRGQISIFIVVTIIIIAVIIGIIFLNNNKKETNISKEFFSSLETQSEFTTLSNSVVNCMEEVTQESLFYIGLRGGYYDKPENVYDLEFVFVPYYNYNKKINTPSKDFIEREIGKYVDNNLKKCFEENWNISKGNTNVKINSEKVDFVINSILTLEKDNSAFLIELKEHPVSHSSSLSDILEVANYFIEEKNKEMMCVTCLEDLLIEKDVYLNSIDLGDLNKLVIISENRTSEEVYAFEFMIKDKLKEANLSNTDLDAFFGE